jgi:hypothetical protein
MHCTPIQRMEPHCGWKTFKPTCHVVHELAPHPPPLWCVIRVWRVGIREGLIKVKQQVPCHPVEGQDSSTLAAWPPALENQACTGLLCCCCCCCCGSSGCCWWQQCDADVEVGAADDLEGQQGAAWLQLQVVGSPAYTAGTKVGGYTATGKPTILDERRSCFSHVAQHKHPHKHPMSPKIRDIL